MTRRQNEYREYLRGPIWKEKRRQVWRRANGRCERCLELGWDNPGRDVHHLRYPRVFGEEDISDLKLVCKDCHPFLHGKSDFDPCYIPTIAELMKKIREM